MNLGESVTVEVSVDNGTTWAVAETLGASGPVLGYNGEWGTHYIDITPGSKEAATNSSLIAADGLHPSATEYTRWAKLLFHKMQNELSR